MAMGLGVLRLDPRAFWSMTPLEFAAAARAILPPAPGSALPTRAELADLMSRFPDHQ
jgi:uncharacterized phage protein (TIGR02216 family)